MNSTLFFSMMSVVLSHWSRSRSLKNQKASAMVLEALQLGFVELMNFYKSMKVSALTRKIFTYNSYVLSWRHILGQTQQAFLPKSSIPNKTHSGAFRVEFFFLIFCYVAGNLVLSAKSFYATNKLKISLKSCY